MQPQPDHGIKSCAVVRNLRMLCVGLWRLTFMGNLLAKSGLWRSIHNHWFGFGVRANLSTKGFKC